MKALKNVRTLLSLLLMAAPFSSAVAANDGDNTDSEGPADSTLYYASSQEIPGTVLISGNGKEVSYSAIDNAGKQYQA